METMTEVGMTLGEASRVAYCIAHERGVIATPVRIGDRDKRFAVVCGDADLCPTIVWLSPPPTGTTPEGEEQP